MRADPWGHEPQGITVQAEAHWKRAKRERERSAEGGVWRDGGDVRVQVTTRGEDSENGRVRDWRADVAK